MYPFYGAKQLLEHWWYLVYNISMRDENGRFIKGHVVIESWKELSSKANKGKASKSKTKFKKGQRVSPQTEFKKGMIPWNKGKSGFMKGESNGMWKGNDVGLSGLHKWVYLTLGQPDTCQHCGKIELKGHGIHWANKSGKYERKVDDWLRLCVTCHRRYDLDRNQT